MDDAAGLDTNDGLTWSTSLATVQAGLDLAAAAVSGGSFSACEVWVAQGTYIPTVPSDSSDPRTATISLVSGVTLYGGFAGTEFVRSERDIAMNPTVLSGDISLDAGVNPSDGGVYVDDTSDNAYNVVTGADDATIDGFTITAGNADGSSSPYNSGGGMYNYSSPTVSNCTFSGNHANSGGGMYNFFSSSTISNCTFSDNSTPYSGGGIKNYFSSPTVINCTFSRATKPMKAAGCTLPTPPRRRSSGASSRIITPAW